ncbi:MAG TPA: hypothetical protein PKB02_14975 [Anaerohalosphaeraceae bacterium]|nr:hypothetical protein [Anaerohalosphaeraceae bacterium]
MSNPNDKLNQAIDALRRMPIPQGPSDELIRQTLNRMDPTQTQIMTPVAGTRRFSMKRMIKFAVAACVIFAVIGGISILDQGTTGIVLADVVQRVQQARAIFYKMHVTTTGQPLTASNAPMNVSGAVWISADYGMKMEMDMNDQPGSITYLLPDQKKLVSVMPEMKKYMEIDLNDDLLSRIKQQNQDPREWIEKMVNSQYKSLGKSTLDGIEVEGFESTDPALAGGVAEQIVVRLWVDTQTGYPVQMDMEMDMNEGKTKMHSVINHFQWNLEVDAAAFIPQIPDDYTALPKMQLPKMDEQSAVAGLKAYLELTGSYPENLSMTGLSDGIQKAPRDEAAMKKQFDPAQFEGLTKEEAMKKAQDQALQKTMDIMMPIQSLAMFYMTLVQDQKDPAYYGKVVTPGDAQSILLRWKTEDGAYRVIMGDLSVVDMSPEQLQQIESQMPPLEQPLPEDSSRSIAPLEDVARYGELQSHGQSMVNIKKMLLACFKYASTNNGQWPQTLESIAGQDDIQIEGHMYIPPKNTVPPQKNVVIYESYQTWGEGINVGFADGHVEFIAQEADFLKLLSQ